MANSLDDVDVGPVALGPEFGLPLGEAAGHDAVEFPQLDEHGDSDVVDAGSGPIGSQLQALCPQASRHGRAQLPIVEVDH